LTSGESRNVGLKRWGTLLPWPLPPVHSIVLLPLPHVTLSFLSPPLRSRPLEYSYRIQSGGCKLPSGVWGGAPEEIEFGAF